MFRLYKTVLNLKTRLQEQNLKKILIFFHYRLNLIICCKTKLKIEFIFYRMSLFYKWIFFTEWNFLNRFKFSEREYRYLFQINNLIRKKKRFLLKKKKLFLYWSLFLIKLQSCNFPVNIAKFFKDKFFHKIPSVAASEKFINFPGKHQWERCNRFIFLINTTE